MGWLDAFHSIRGTGSVHVSIPESETYYAGAYWLARPESAEACAQRAEHFFRLLAACDTAWNQWHDTAAAKRARAPLVNPTAGTFLGMFGKKKYRSGTNGFSFWFWVGNTVPSATSVNVSCGSATPRAPSVSVVQFPSEGPVADRVLTAPVLTDVVRAMALAWEPEWAIATSHAHRDLLPQPPRAGTFVGWVMYFSRQRGTVPPLPSPVRVEPVEELGTLVILTPERFTASNPEHVALAARVQALLEQAGLLGPLQPHKS